VGLLIKLFRGTPLHVQVHGDFNNRYFPVSSLYNFIRFFLAHLVLPYADSVRVVSERIRESVKDLNKNVEVLPIRIDSSNKTVVSRRENSEKINILTVARLEKEKDLGTAIKAFALVSNKYPNAVFTIAGEGSLERNLKELVKDLGLGEKVKFIGWVNNLPELYAASDIYISTSLFEGYGMSMVEAAFHGLAIVATDAGIAPDITGALVCKPRDLASLAQNLEKLVSDNNLREEIGQKTKNWALSHIINQEQYLNLYKQSVEKALVAKKKNLIKAVFEGNKVLRFLVGGGTAAFTQILFLYIFTDLLHMWYLLSSIFSFCIAFVVSFLLQKLWVFGDKRVEGAHVQFMKYVLVGLLGIGLNTLIMYLF